MRVPIRRVFVFVGVIVAAIAASGGCGFAHVALHNAPYFFQRPADAPRHDGLKPGPTALSVVWVGHATVALQLGGRVVVTDPVFGETVATLSRRLVAPGLTVAALPDDVVVLISHRHMDHLSQDSLAMLRGKTDVVVVPRGAEADIEGHATHGLRWGETVALRGLRVTAVRVAHRGDRLPTDSAALRDHAFAGYVVEADDGSAAVFFAGDTAFDAAVFDDVGARFGAVLDVAILPIGPISPPDMMRPNHLDPRQALDAFARTKATLMVPMHYQTFLHSLDEPGDVEAALLAALTHTPALEQRVKVLAAGERLDVRP